MSRLPHRWRRAPLSIVNCDNRILANALRLRLEPIFAEWVSEGQRGFLPGRSLLANVLDMEEAMLRTAVEQESGGTVLFDIKAAFPSVSHGYMFDVLAGLGTPPEALHFLRSLYDEGRRELIVGGGRRRGFNMSSGIRQGRPCLRSYSPRCWTRSYDVSVVDNRGRSAGHTWTTWA